MFGRCKHQWILKSCSHEFKGWGDRVTVLAQACTHCGDMRTKRISGWHKFENLATVTDYELERISHGLG